MRQTGQSAQAEGILIVQHLVFLIRDFSANVRAICTFPGQVGSRFAYGKVYIFDIHFCEVHRATSPMFRSLGPKNDIIPGPQVVPCARPTA